MNTINFCVVLYDKRIEDSDTVNELKLYFKKKNIDGNVVVFNNGPSEVDTPSEAYITVHQVLVNASLAKIYNKFIELYESDSYVFLDDDTKLNEEYIDEVIATDFNILFPRISCNNKIHYPVLANKKIQTITSGLALSNKFVNDFINNYEIAD